ncbi:hypothetical protein F5880DRAFT_1616510 [Lentinula raphanica]|nr:hypothetical protein F5880DRAFT_1616510 [Lentinula raphanica]
MGLQAQIPASLAALHNFILDHDPTEHIPTDLYDPIPGAHLDPAELSATQGELSVTRRTETETNAGWRFREEIAQAMWDDYVVICEQRILAEELAIGSDTDDS